MFGNANVFSAIYFNARSLKKNCNKISTLLHTLNHHFSIILTCEDRDMYGFADYGCEYDHRSGSPYGGSAIFVSKQLTYCRRNDLNINVPKCEYVWVELDQLILKMVQGQSLAPFTALLHLMQLISAMHFFLCLISCLSKTKMCS